MPTKIFREHVLGQGASSKVFLGEDDMKNKVAIKVIDKTSTANRVLSVAEEIETYKYIQEMTKIKGIVNLEGHWSDSQNDYLSFEYVPDNLQASIVRQGGLREEVAIKISANVLSTLSQMHKASIIHRDIKCDNILLFPDTLETRIADLGFSHVLAYKTQMLTISCGSPAYAAPELIAGKPYNAKVDIWSFGVTLFAMLTARLPFQQSDKRELFKAVRTPRSYSYTPAECKRISPLTRSLIDAMLTVEPLCRPSAESCLTHPIFAHRTIHKRFDSPQYPPRRTMKRNAISLDEVLVKSS